MENEMIKFNILEVYLKLSIFGFLETPDVREGKMI